MATLTRNPLSSHPFVRGATGATLESTDGSVSMDSSDFVGRDSPQMLMEADNQSCCSDDTVLSVGNEQEQLPPRSPAERPDQPPPELCFKNIESHLNAISKITNSTLDPMGHHQHHAGSIKSDPSSPNSQRLSPASSKSFNDSPAPFHLGLNNNRGDKSPMRSPASPSSQRTFSGPASPQSPKSETKQHFYFRPNVLKMDNVEPTNGCLKFSIDNILKADFGRRITEPINIRKSKPPKKLSAESARGGCERDAQPTAAPVDLSRSEADRAPTSQQQPQGQQQQQSPSTGAGSGGKDAPILWPAWVYCTRYSDRPSSGPRTRRVKKPTPPGTKPSSASVGAGAAAAAAEEKRPRTAFSGAQLARLKHEFAENRYLTERRRQQLSGELGLNEAQIKIWFQNKRAKIKKASGQKNPLALQLMAQGLYNHSTIPLTKEEEELQEMHNKSAS